MKRVSSYVALALYAAIILAAWAEVRTHPAFGFGLGGHLRYAFASFAWLLAPLWFFGFRLGDWLRASLRPAPRILLPALLGCPYLFFAGARGDFRWTVTALLFALPVALAALLEYSHLPPRLAWPDVAVLVTLAATVLLKLLAPAWPYPGLAALPKLFVADLALYLYMVVRRLEGMGYSLIPSLQAVRLGLRELVFFLPFVLVIGFATHFIHFHRQLSEPTHAAGILAATFLLVAIPEEMFFRCILQNLLQTRFAPRTALLVTSLLFGLAHFNKGAVFNWRYVLLATIAGVFYGRAWRAKRQLLASVTTHTAVDVIWALWFR